MPGARRLRTAGPPGEAGGAGQCVALGLLVEFGKPGLAQLDGHRIHRRSSRRTLSFVMSLALRPGGADREIA
jgi:hypothetical protein